MSGKVWRRAAAAAMLLAATVAGGASAQGTARVLGRVTDDAGRPVPGATVVVVTGGARAPGGQARSEDTGGFQLAALPAGSYRLRVEKVGYAPQEQDVVLGDGEQRTVVLRLQTARASRTVQAQRAMLPQRRP